MVAFVLFVQVIYFMRRRSLARRAEAQAENVVLAAGDAVVFGTTANVDDSTGPPVKITVTQHGLSFESKGKSGKSLGWTTKWKETSRKREVRPFILRMSSASSSNDVRVFPDERVELLDSLEESGRAGPERWLVAQLDEGEKAYVFGTLSQEIDSRSRSAAAGGGYRSAGTSWVLRPSRGRAMMLSVGRMSERFGGDVRLRSALAGALLVFVLIAQAISIPYHVALWRGHTEPAEVVSVRVEAAAKKKDTQILMTFRRLTTGQELTDRISERDQSLFLPKHIIPIHVVRFMDEDRITLGVGASQNAGLSLVPLLLSFVVIGLVLWIVLTTKQWYEKRRLVHKTEGKAE